MTRRCLNCGRDYPDGPPWCHQCGEPLRGVDEAAERATPRETAGGARRRSLVGRPPARTPASALLLLLLLAAGVSLALLWHQRWVPAARVAAKLPEGPPPGAVDPPPAPLTIAPEAPVVPPPPAAGPARAAAPPPAGESRPPTAPAVAATKPGPPPPPAAEPARKPPLTTARAGTDPERAGAGRPAIAAGPSASAPRVVAPAAAGSSTPSAGAGVPGARVITLVPVGAGSGARGELHWEHGLGGRLVVAGLPPPPAGRTYQVWLGSIRQGNRASGGVLTVDAQGSATHRIAPLRASWSPDIFGVTVERQGGALDPSDELVLVGELTRQTPSAPRGADALAPAPLPRSPTTPAAPAVVAALPEAGRDGGGPGSPSAPPATEAAGTPAPPAPEPDSPRVRIVPAPLERTWSVTESVLRSLGWRIDRAEPAEGLIRTRPRDVDFKNLGVYAAGTRHSLDIVIRPVSSSHTSITVRRELFAEQRFLWSKERTSLTARDTAVEQTVLDAIEHLL